MRVLFLAATVVFASGSTLTLADVNARYGELQAVIDAINDPDPLMRLAQLEEIVAKGNATDVQLAIRTAFSVDDPNVRSLALRAHFASFKTFIVTADYPQDIKKLLETGDEKAKTQLKKDHYRLLDFLSTQGNQFSFRSEYPSKDALEFTVRSLNSIPDSQQADQYAGNGNIRGGLINIVSAVKQSPNSSAPINCSFEFTEYEAFTLKGTGACNMEGSFPFPIMLQLFDNDKPAQ